MALHDLLGPVLASLAVILSLFVFKRTLDYQAYRELDSNYMKALTIGISKPYLRDPKITKNFEKTTSGYDENKKTAYEQYANLVWNICETVYDRKKVDKTWAPAIRVEKELHLEWLKKNETKFKPEFVKFVFGTNLETYNPKSMKVKAAKPYLIIGSILLIFIIGIPVLYNSLPSFFDYTENFDRHVAMECARDYKVYNVSHPYDCSKFLPGSLAELCVLDHNAFNIRNIAGCSRYISPGEGS